ncbi:MAG: hypothetical protein KAT68_06155 [Bacteroidales bacterium]|nr:hypothetical protein [Bacteroidales bacterium]
MTATTTFKMPTSTAPIIYNALKRELEILKININNTIEKLKIFENKHNISSKKFYQKFSDGQMGDSQDIMLWASEFEALSEITTEYKEIKKILDSWRI